MLPRVAVLGPSALFHAASRQRAACNAFSVDRVGQPAKSTTEFGKAGLNLSRPRPITRSCEHKRVGDGRAGPSEAQSLPIPRARWRAGPGRCRERADARPGRAIPPVISVAVGSIGHSGICIHRVAVMSPVRGQSGRSGESEDSKTNKNASGHSRLP